MKAFKRLLSKRFSGPLQMADPKAGNRKKPKSRYAILGVLFALFAVSTAGLLFSNQSNSTSSPSLSAGNYYLPLDGNESRIFVVSANLSLGEYPYDSRNDIWGTTPVVTKGEPCFIINATLRNDYSTQSPPPNVNPANASLAYVCLTAEIYNDQNQLDSTDLLRVGLPPNAGAVTALYGGENDTITIYLASNSANVTSFQLVPVFISGIPVP